jgi:UDP-N-acetylmuramoylalanine--D-glutamate ligase
VPLNLKGKRVLVLGLGASGMSMARWLTLREAVVSVADTRAEPPFANQLREELPGVRLSLGGFRAEDFAGAEVIAISPGVPLSEPALRMAHESGIPIVGDIELFARVREEYPESKVIGITGSNGKSTVTEMVGAMCRSTGIRTLVAGNIGLPILDAISDIDSGRRRRPDIFVLELSSFQLETTESLNPEAATVLNLTACRSSTVRTPGPGRWRRRTAACSRSDWMNRTVGTNGGCAASKASAGLRRAQRI